MSSGVEREDGSETSRVLLITTSKIRNSASDAKQHFSHYLNKRCHFFSYNTSLRCLIERNMCQLLLKLVIFLPHKEYENNI